MGAEGGGGLSGRWGKLSRRHVRRPARDFWPARHVRVGARSRRGCGNQREIFAQRGAVGYVRLSGRAVRWPSCVHSQRIRVGRPSASRLFNPRTDPSRAFVLRAAHGNCPEGLRAKRAAWDVAVAASPSKAWIDVVAIIRDARCFSAHLRCRRRLQSRSAHRKGYNDLHDAVSIELRRVAATPKRIRSRVRV